MKNLILSLTVSLTCLATPALAEPSCGQPAPQSPIQLRKGFAPFRSLFGQTIYVVEKPRYPKYLRAQP